MQEVKIDICFLVFKHQMKSFGLFCANSCCLTMLLFLLVSVVSISVGVISGAAEGDEVKATIRHKRQLPLKLNCNVQSMATSDRCYKGDLIDESIADCIKTSLHPVTCDPINKDPLSTTVDVPDANGVICVPASGMPVLCGDGDTRCVCVMLR